MCGLGDFYFYFVWLNLICDFDLDKSFNYYLFTSFLFGMIANLGLFYELLLNT